MRLNISFNTLSLMLESKTLVKIFQKVIEGYNEAIQINPEMEGIAISMEDLRKALRYKNKSTVSRGLKELAKLGLFELETSNQGTVILFSNERIKTVD